ncbi:HIT family protein [Candidatus Woesearchaeota archaeon]|nr:HIT family protein [Candidatus Woesearchaeota archaeon]
MEPLKDEQLLELEEISKLPQEQQQIRIKDFFSKLSPGQIEWLKNQQQQTSGNQCPFCLIAEGKIRARVLYNDDLIMAILDINPANKGHILLFPKEHIKDSFTLDNILFLSLMNIANKIAEHIVKVVNATGANILIANGESAGQKLDHFLIHIIPRFDDDKVKLIWEPQKISEEDMNFIVENFKGFMVESIKKEEPKIEEVKEEQQNYYYVDENNRIP